MTVNFSRPHFIAGRAAGSPQVVFEAVAKLYRPRGAAPVAALSDVSFAVRRGEVFGIIGRSGAGKSTLIRLVNGLETPTAGTVSIEGTDVAALGRDDLNALRRRIGMIFQGFNLLASRSVLDNVALPLRLAGVPKHRARAAASEALDLVGLADKAGAFPGRLSGGQQQRAGIARAIVGKPDLLLSDEATSALDPETTGQILALLKHINRTLGLTVILITHEMAVIREVADRVAVIEAGRIAETGEGWQVFGAPRHAATRALLKPHAADLPDMGSGEDEGTVFRLPLASPDGRDPDLFAIAAAAGPGARLLGGAVDRIKGRATGQLLLQVPRRGAAEDPGAVLARLRAVLPGAEIVRHAE